jgi:hypothetical protein
MSLWLRLKLWWATNPYVIKLKTWCGYSLTVGWGYLKILVGMLLLSTHEVIQMLQTVITDPEVKAAINSMNFPAYVGLGLAIIGCVTLAARMRRHSETPIQET